MLHVETATFRKNDNKKKHYNTNIKIRENYQQLLLYTGLEAVFTSCQKTKYEGPSSKGTAREKQEEEADTRMIEKDPSSLAWRKRSKQGLTIAKGLTIEHPEGRDRVPYM